MTIEKFVEMQKRYLNEFLNLEKDQHKTCAGGHSYIEWNEIFELWIDENKVMDIDDID